jgi:hypothetical protein
MTIVILLPDRTGRAKSPLTSDPSRIRPSRQPCHAAVQQRRPRRSGRLAALGARPCPHREHNYLEPALRYTLRGAVEVVTSAVVCRSLGGAARAPSPLAVWALRLGRLISIPRQILVG